MNILVAVDSDPESADAASAAKQFFGDDHHYIFLSIADFVTSVSSIGSNLGPDLAGAGQSVRDDAHRHAETSARRHAETTDATNSEVVVDVGAVGPTICEHALESSADIIVMGSREHSLWHRIFDPSAGRYVIDHAPCPVLVVR